MSTFKSVISTLSGAFKEVRSAQTKLKADKAKAEKRKADLEAQRAELYAQPLTPAEVKAAMIKVIDDRAAKYLLHIGASNLLGAWMTPSRQVVGGEKLPLGLQDVESMILGAGADLPEHNRLDDGGMRLGLIPTQERFGLWAYFFLGDVMKAKLDDILLACPRGREAVDGDGSTLGQRRQQIASIDAELAQLNSEIARMTAELTEIEKQFSVDQPEETEEQIERRVWAQRLGCDPDREPERFAHLMKQQQDYQARLNDDAKRPAPWRN